MGLEQPVIDEEPGRFDRRRVIGIESNSRHPSMTIRLFALGGSPSSFDNRQADEYFSYNVSCHVEVASCTEKMKKH